MRLKSGVSIRNLRPEMVIAVMIANDLYHLFNHELVITSGRDGMHAVDSAHYRGSAVDIRTRDFNPQTLPGIIETLKESLGKEYYVLLEADHIHIQYNGGI